MWWFVGTNPAPGPWSSVWVFFPDFEAIDLLKHLISQPSSQRLSNCRSSPRSIFSSTAFEAAKIIDTTVTVQYVTNNIVLPAVSEAYSDHSFSKANIEFEEMVDGKAVYWRCWVVRDTERSVNPTSRDLSRAGKMMWNNAKSMYVSEISGAVILKQSTSKQSTNLITRKKT